MLLEGAEGRKKFLHASSSYFDTLAPLALTPSDIYFGGKEGGPGEAPEGVAVEGRGGGDAARGRTESH